MVIVGIWWFWYWRWGCEVRRWWFGKIFRMERLVGCGGRWKLWGVFVVFWVVWLKSRVGEILWRVIVVLRVGFESIVCFCKIIKFIVTNEAELWPWFSVLSLRDKVGLLWCCWSCLLPGTSCTRMGGVKHPAW